MRAYIAAATLLVAAASGGCGSSASGPAKPEDTPVVNQEDVQAEIKKSMSPDMMKKYGSKMNPSGS